MLQSPTHSIETKASWLVASVSLGILAFSFGAPWITAVALKEIAAEVDGLRSVPSLAVSLVWFGSGLGGIAMGQIAERIGIRWTVMFGATMIALGLFLSTYGPPWPLYIGHGLLMGLIGLSGINAPLYVYVSRWFDRRRGSALALISSGTYVAGAFWPPAFERAIAYAGWRQAMLGYALVQLVVVVPLAAIFLKRPPELPQPVLGGVVGSEGLRVLGWPPNAVFALLMAAIFMCCIPMSMPQGHLVAFCTDLGINAAHGALMLSVLLGAAFFSRQIWGLISDRIGGLRTVLIGSVAQAFGMAAFLLTQDEVGCSRSRPRSGSASPGSSRRPCWRSASCFRPARRRGACRRCCSAAPAAWPPEAGSPGSSTTVSATTARPLRPASPSTCSTSRSSRSWSAANGP
jgi:MFS family permease